MTPLVPIMMFGWIILSIAAFTRKSPADAVILVVVGGVLFLPMYAYDVPFLQEYSKVIAVASSLIIGELVGNARKLFPVQRCTPDILVLCWCVLSPMATSLSNGLGAYNGLTNVAINLLSWAVFYWAGRRYFGSAESLRKLTLALVVGGLIYLPLIVFEVRMSPQLSRIVYGFFPHSFVQHIRYGGFRPIVFMQHGLMVAFWSGASAIAAFWLWRSKAVSHLKGVPMALVVLALAAVTVLCKSIGPLLLMLLGIGGYFIIWKAKSLFLIKALLLCAVGYVALRMSGVLQISGLETVLMKYFDAERVQSALARMTEEDLFGARARLQPLFGWGGFSRGWPIDPRTGERLIGMIDSLWIILFSTFGLFGLVSAFGILAAGPLMFIRSLAKARNVGSAEAPCVDSFVICLIVALFIIDCLQNAMFNPFYVLCTGALVSYAMSLDEARSASGAAVSIPGIGCQDVSSLSGADMPRG